MVTRGGKERGGVGGRGWVAGRAGDFASRVIVKLSSIYFTNLHITSAVVAASQRRVQKRGGRGMGATRRVSSATYVRKYMHVENGGKVVGAKREGGGCVFCYRPERGCRRRPTLWLQPRPTYDVRTR